MKINEENINKEIFEKEIDKVGINKISKNCFTFLNFVIMLGLEPKTGIQSQHLVA